MIFSITKDTYSGRIMTAGVLCLLAAPAYAKKQTCDYIDKPKLKVNINLTVPDATYDHTRSAQQMSDDHFETTVNWLQKQGISSIGMARHMGQHYQIRGLTSGGYAYHLNYKAQAKHVDKYGVYYCPYLTEVNIDFFYATRIFMAKEISKTSCEYNEVMKHEWKHHTANVMAVKTYSDRLRKDLPKITREIELKSGYVDRSLVDRTFKDIEQSVTDMIDIYFDSIKKDYVRRNDMIDTPDEYRRVDHAIDLCKKERRKQR